MTETAISPAPRYKPGQVFLVGMMGAGKSTIGQHLAKEWQHPFIDIDKRIEARAGVKIAVIFEYEGESGFRRRESELLAEICADAQPAVIATGGGLPINEGNRTLLRSSGLTIYLHATPDVLFERTRRDQNRPLLQVPNRLETLRQLYDVRDTIYRQCAQIIVDSTRQSVRHVVNRLLTLVEQAEHGTATDPPLHLPEHSTPSSPSA